MKLGEYDYEVVNGAKYRWIMNEEKRREQNRVAQEKFRAKKKAIGSGTLAEKLYVKECDGSDETQVEVVRDVTEGENPVI